MLGRPPATGVRGGAASERQRDRQELLELRRRQGFAPPGHFYSPVPDSDEFRRKDSRIFQPQPPAVPGVNLHPQGQLRLKNPGGSIWLRKQ